MGFVIKENTLERYIEDGTENENVIIPEGVKIIGREAFACTHIKEVKFPDSVHKIDYYAFCSSNLREIQLGSAGQLELIMDSAFEENEYLAEITIPASVTEIGYNAFKGCACLEHVYFENGSKLKTICSGAFKGCKALKEIDLPDSVAYIGKECFEGCENLTGNVAVPKKCRIVDERTFNGCKRLSAIIVPGNVEKIGRGAFGLCDGLKAVIINGGVKSIGSYAFQHCISLTSIVLPNSIIDIGAFAFENCVSLDHIDIPNISKIKQGAFYLSGLKTVVIPGSVRIIEKLAFKSCTLESVVIQNGVATIEEASFEDCDSLKSINIPGSVESVGFASFADCGALSEVVVSEGVKTIERFAFANCSGLKKISLPGSLEYISANTFDGDIELEEITVEGYSPYYVSENGILYRSKKEYLVRCPPKKKQINVPHGVIGLSNDAFRECKLIEHISLPATLGILDTKSFSSCSNLESITVDEKNMSYCDVGGVLYNKEKTSLIFCPPRIKYISIPDSVRRIENNALEECSLLKSVVLPNGLEHIGHSAFKDCKSLTSVTIPDSVTEFGGFAFEGTTWLAVQQKESPIVIINDVIIDGTTCSGDINISGASRIGDLAFHNSAIKGVTFSQEVHTIGEGAFIGCRNLEKLTIPESILEIGVRIFHDCTRLTVVTIPEDILYFGIPNGCFHNNYNLKDIEITHSNNKNIRYDSVDGAVYELDDNGKPTKLVICPPGKGEIYIPTGVKSIAENAFESCIDISELHLPTTLSFKDTAWYDKLCESKKHDGDIFIEGNNSEDYQYNKDHDIVVMVLETFFCSKDSEACRFAKEHNINVEIDETENQ